MPIQPDPENHKFRRSRTSSPKRRGFLPSASGIPASCDWALDWTDLYDRITEPTRNDARLLSPSARALDQTMLIRNLYDKNMMEEDRNIARNSKTVIENGRLTNIPLI